MEHWSTWEIFGVIFGVISVWLTVRQHVLCWLTGLVSVALFAVTFYQTRLYADTILQLIYVVLNLYGWWEWTHPGAGKKELPVTRLSSRGWIVITVIFLAGEAAVGTFFSHTAAAWPWIDSATTVASLIAQVLLTRKIMENWFIWITADVVMIWMYYEKGLQLTSALYVVFLIMCIFGIREWRKTLVSLDAAPAGEQTVTP